MADKDFNALPVGTPAQADTMALQKPGGVMYQTPVQNVLNNFSALGEAHSNADFNMLSVTTTPRRLEGYDLSQTAEGLTVTLTPVLGPPDTNQAKFVVNANKEGTYRVTFNIDVGSTTNENADFVVYKNGFPTSFKASVDMSGSSTDHDTASINTFLPGLVENDEIEVYVNSDGTTFASLLIDSLTFTLKRESTA